MGGRILIAGIFFGILFDRIRSESFFIAQDGEETISEHNLLIDESFFDCDRTKSCKENVKKTAQEKQTVWNKIPVIFGSCKKALEDELGKRQKYWIKHEGMPNAVEVRCLEQGGKILAVMNHDSEAKTRVKGYEDPGSYKRNFTYENNLRDIISFVETAASCRQFTRIDCYGVTLYRDGATSFHGYLVDRNGGQMDYIGGGPQNSRGCACSITNTCPSGKKCYCDANLSKWQYDQGYVTEKARLPLTGVSLGDTGGSTEDAYHTIGKLECEE